jgi:hypothetical protein
MEANVLTAPPLIGRSHPGINFSRLEIPGDVGGLVFTVGVVITMLIGLPLARPFFCGAFAGGLLVAAAIRAWTRHGRPGA